MPEDNTINRRNFAESRPRAGTAGGNFFETLAPGSMKAATSPAVPATAQLNAGAFGWNMNADAPMNKAPNAIVNPNVLMIMVDQSGVPQYWLTSSSGRVSLRKYCWTTWFLRWGIWPC